MSDEMITKPDANPIVYALASWFTLGFLGYFLMGQSKKGIFAFIYANVLGIVTCGFGYMIAFAFIYDAYLLGQKLQSGESIGMSENALGFLDKLPGFN